MNLKVAYHLLLCATSSKSLCCEKELGNQSWEKLKEVLTKLNLDSPKRSNGLILRSKVDCLRVCNNGPILLVWPDGIWYQNVSPDRVERIIENHIINNKPLEEWIFKKTPLNNNFN